LKIVIAGLTILFLCFVWGVGSLAFSTLYSDAVLVPLTLEPAAEEDNAGLGLIKFIIRPWVATTKLEITGLEGCKSGISANDIPAPMINTLVILNENLMNKAGVKDYILKYKSMGCNINSTEVFGLTPVQNAILARDIEMVKFLLSLGASVNVRTVMPERKGHDLDAIGFSTLLKELKPSAEIDAIISILNNET